MDVNFDEVFENVMMNAIIAACDGNGVLDGLTVSENGAGADMSVDVAAGNCMISGTKYTESSTTNLAISAADATYDRKDLVVYDSSAGDPAVVTGTAAATPIPPDIPAGDILLAIVDVAAGATAITDADIVDGVVIISQPGVPKTLFDAYTMLYADTDDTPAALSIPASSFVGRKASGGIAAMTTSEAKTLLAIDATDISNTPAGDIAATDVQAAINELDTEKLPTAGGTLTGDVTCNDGVKILHQAGAPFTIFGEIRSIGASSYDVLFKITLLDGYKINVLAASLDHNNDVTGSMQLYDTTHSTEIYNSGNITYEDSGNNPTTFPVSATASGITYYEVRMHNTSTGAGNVGGFMVLQIETT